MEFITERIVTETVVNDQPGEPPLIEETKIFVLLEEIIHKIDISKLCLLLRSGKITLFHLLGLEPHIESQPMGWEWCLEPDGSLYYGNLWIEKQDVKSLWIQDGAARIDDHPTREPIEKSLRDDDKPPEPPQQALEPIEVFVKSLRDDARKFWDAVQPRKGPNAYRAAIEFLKRNPGMRITPDDLQEGDFRFVEKPKRAILGVIIQRILSKNGYENLGQSKIEELLK